jgi:formylglycine-generating enzyme required for sulfatase activity
MKEFKITDSKLSEIAKSLSYKFEIPSDSLLEELTSLLTQLQENRFNIETIFIKGNNEINDFYIGKYPVTQRQWVEVMDDNPSYFKGCDDCPVESVSWNDAQEFIKKLNEITKKTYRLPSEKEWEYAAKGGEMSLGYDFSGSNNINDVAWHWDNAGRKTRPVGQKRPNELGLYDMNGNVWEWCDDLYDEGGSFRVYRGGSWLYTPQFCRAANRGIWQPVYRGRDLGFRLALSRNV